MVTVHIKVTMNILVADNSLALINNKIRASLHKCTKTLCALELQPCDPSDVSLLAGGEHGRWLREEREWPPKLLLQIGTSECKLHNRHIQDITRRCHLAAERTVCWDFQWTVTSRCHYLWCGCQNILHWRSAGEKWFLPAVMEEWSCELMASAGAGAPHVHCFCSDGVREESVCSKGND